MTVEPTPLPLSRVAYERLREDIISGVLVPGQPLRLESLGTRYGLSFSPLREALNQLQVERLVTSTTKRGFRVAPFSITEMWEAIEARILIESEVIRQAINHGDDDWEGSVISSLHGLEKARTRLANADGNPSPEELHALELRHEGFHVALLAGAPSSLLKGIAQTLYGQTERYRRPLLALNPRVDRGDDHGPDDEHRALAMAVTDRDAAAATRLLEQHLRGTGQFVENAYAASGKKLVVA